MTKVRSITATRVFFVMLGGMLFALQFILAGCNESQSNGKTLGAMAPNHADGALLDPNTPTNAGVNAVSPPSSNTMSIAVRYVVLEPDSTTTPSPSQSEVVTLLKGMSDVWSQCEIQFVLDKYEAHVASDEGLLYTPANQSELEEMRSKYDDKAHALYVKTGKWDRSGDLGNDSSNGFSTVPPANPEGSVIEESVATIALLLSHETGHLIGGLLHTDDSTNLMNHFVTPKNTLLDQTQCNDTRTAMQQYHTAWTR